MYLLATNHTRHGNIDISQWWGSEELTETHQNVNKCIFLKIYEWFIMFPDSKVHGANMGPTWVLSAPDGPHVGPQEPCYNALSLLLVLTERIYYVGRRNPR